MAAARFSSPPPRAARKVLTAALPVTEDEFIVNVTTAVSGDVVGQLLVTKETELYDVRKQILSALGLGRLHEAHLVKGDKAFTKPFDKPFKNAVHNDDFGVTICELEDMAYLDMEDRRGCHGCRR